MRERRAIVIEISFTIFERKNAGIIFFSKFLKKFQHFSLLKRYIYESAKDNGSCLGKETEVQV